MHCFSCFLFHWNRILWIRRLCNVYRCILRLPAYPSSHHGSRAAAFEADRHQRKTPDDCGYEDKLVEGFVQLSKTPTDRKRNARAPSSSARRAQPAAVSVTIASVPSVDVRFQNITSTNAPKQAASTGQRTASNTDICAICIHICTFTFRELDYAPDIGNNQA